MLNAIAKPFGWLMLWLYEFIGDYGLAVIAFALIVKLILWPFMAKSKRSTLRSTRLQPKIKELEKRHGANKQKYNEELQKLYQQEGINPMSGCLWSLIPFPILIALYGVIRQPLERMMGIAKDDVAAITKWASENAGFVATKQGTYDEIGVVDAIHQHWDAAVDALGTFGDKLLNLDYSFLGMNLGTVPDWKIWNYDFSNSETLLPALGLFLIPIIAAFLSWASMKISQATNPPQPGQAAASMKSMNIFMPIMSVWICFIMPAALGVYWIANSVFGILRDIILTKVYKRKLDIEDAERIAAAKERDEEMRRRHAETEQLRAEGATTRNVNTSKKKMQAQQKQTNDERRAANERAEREARREMLGVEKAENPSQVGKRRYARGRAYDPNRYKTSEAAEKPAEEAVAELEPQAEDKPE